MRVRSLLFASLIALAIGVTPASGEEARVVFVRDGVFKIPTDDAWAAIPESTHDLQAQMVAPPVGGGSVTRVSMRAVHDGEELAIRLSWADPSADRGVGVNTFRDAAAIGFPAGGPGSIPSPFMGDAENPVVIWQWAADFDANAEGNSRFGERYPHSEGVWIFPQDISVRRKVRGWRGAEPVIEYIARGFGTLTPRSGASVSGISDYADGRWSLVLRRKLTTSVETDAVFAPGEPTPFILAVWNGGQEDVNGRKAVTYAWIPASFDPLGSATTVSGLGHSSAVE